MELFLFATASRPALGPSQPPVQWVLGALTPTAKGPVREVDHSTSSKNAWCLVKHRDNFTFGTSLDSY
jgi:hypothetical protein